MLLLTILTTLSGAAHAAPQQTLGNLDFPDPSITFDPQTSHECKPPLRPPPAREAGSTKPTRASGPQTSSTSTAPTRSYCTTRPGSATRPTTASASPRPPTSRARTLRATSRGRVPFRRAGPSTRADSATRPTVVYKVDGSAKGPGGPCGNGDPPGEPTPFRLQKVDERDGITPVDGGPVEILDRIPEVDGPLIEAPSIVKGPRTEEKFVLFYSSHCFNVPEYDVKYATAERIGGPYERKGQLIGRGDFGFEAPGGATGVAGGGAMVLHVDCPAGRCMYETEYVMEDGDISIPT
ncbi:hypothetical protein MMYC01_210104 [Madurella mycetomatis]|uniref:Uncharacterized protein n=1 Tax=Madurella mycetomatis TaxID=100816 RepID=A0A175VQA8_9PEZI|nr:hypothetical protein MMYC01_210104 [Madurella mycetomatis]